MATQAHDSEEAKTAAIRATSAGAAAASAAASAAPDAAAAAAAAAEASAAAAADALGGDDSTAQLAELTAGLQALEARAAEYNQLAKQIHETEQQCVKELAKQRKAIQSFIKAQSKRLAKASGPSGPSASGSSGSSGSSSKQQAPAADPPRTTITHQDLSTLNRKLQDVEFQFPREPSLMLRLALGASAPVSLRPLKLRMTYKRDYETFKLSYTLAMSLLILLLFVVTTNRILDAVFQFGLLYYYCTITLREHILVVNGSRIRKWWLGHHYLSIILSGVVLIWPPGVSYHSFRPMFLPFCLYLCMLQTLQYRYQRKRLYALVALDKARPMDTVIGDGVASQAVDREFLLLAPFLVGGQAWQVWISAAMWRLYAADPAGTQWQVVAVGCLFGVLGVGNLFVTALTVVGRKSALQLAARSANTPAFASFKKD